MEDTCRRAVEVGLPAVAFTEHVDFTDWGALSASQNDAATGLALHLDPTAATDDDFSAESSRVSRDDPVPAPTGRELDRAAGVEHEFKMLTWEPSGLQTWERLKLCEQVLTQAPYRGDCIVWLRLAPTSLPQYEVTHGQVTFYNAAYLSGFVGHPELADRFHVPPMEVLNPPEIPPILRQGEIEWEDDWNMAYARVVLPDTEIHAAEAKARTLVEALKAVNHATKDTWRLLNGSILFINGHRHSPMSWGLKEDIKDPYYPQNDWMGRDIERMSRSNRTLDSQSMHDLQDAIGMSTTRKIALDESPEATVGLGPRRRGPRCADRRGADRG